MSKKSNNKNEVKYKKIKFWFIILYPVALVLIILLNLLLFKGSGILLILGALLIIPPIIGIKYKIPLFNRQYIYKSDGFDNRFGLRDYIVFSSMISSGVILLLISFVMSIR